MRGRGEGERKRGERERGVTGIHLGLADLLAAAEIRQEEFRGDGDLPALLPFLLEEAETGEE